MSGFSRGPAPLGDLLASLLSSLAAREELKKCLLNECYLNIQLPVQSHTSCLLQVGNSAPGIRDVQPQRDPQATDRQCTLVILIQPDSSYDLRELGRLRGKSHLKTNLHLL